MMKLISFFNTLVLLSFLAAGSTSAQISRITKIIDTNLFELEDGRKICMAGIEMPVKDIPGKNMQKIVRNILDFERTALLKRKLIILPADTCGTDTAVSPCYLIKQYDLEPMDYNLRFIELGYGRFLDNVDSTHRVVYLKAEGNAIKRRNGIWNYRSPELKDTLDRKYSLSEASHYITLDSLYQIELLRRTARPLGWNITLQTITGTLAGAGGAIMLGFAAGSVFINNSNSYDVLAVALVGGTIGYSAGVSIGVYGIAKTNNPALDYLSVLGISTISTFAGLGTALGSRNGAAWIVPLILPVAATVIYVNAIAPNPVRDNKPDKSVSSPRSSNAAYKDYYNRNIQFSVDIIKIPL